MEERWIIDGNYAATMEMRLGACDTVFFLDYPARVCLEGIRARRGKPRPDMPWVEGEGEEDADLTAFVARYRADSRPAVLALLERYADREIHRFRTRDEAEAYLQRL